MIPIQPIKGIDIYLLDQFQKGRLSPNMKVLDAGCGSGRNIRLLIDQGYDVSAMDQNPAAVAQLQSEYPELESHFSVSRIEDYPDENKYDFIICNAVLHFASDHSHFEAMFKKLVACIKQGGILFIRMTSNIGLEERLGNGVDGVYSLPDGSTRYLLTRPKVDELVEEYGFRLLEPVKTVFVDGLRSMTTLVFRK